MFDDNIFTSNSAAWGTTSSGVPMDTNELLALMKKLEATRPTVDGFAFTHHQWSQIVDKLHIETIEPTVRDAYSVGFDRMFGLPIWLFNTQEECLKHAADMMEKDGTKIGFVTEGGKIVGIPERKFVQDECWLHSSRRELLRGF